MTSLALKCASASRSSGTWKDEHYDVLADGKVVGRILEEGSRFGPPAAHLSRVRPAAARVNSHTSS